MFSDGQGYERPLPTGRKLRVILSREAEAEIISFTSNYCIEWKARFDSAVPLAVFEAAITAAIAPMRAALLDAGRGRRVTVPE